MFPKKKHKLGKANSTLSRNSSIENIRLGRSLCSFHGKIFSVSQKNSAQQSSIFELGPDSCLELIGYDDSSRQSEDVSELSLEILDNCQHLSTIGHLFHNLLTLHLDNNAISDIRELGTRLSGLTTLTLNSCQLTDLDGISAFPNLEKLMVANNYINDISSLSMHESIQFIDLSGNKIRSFDSIYCLSSCLSLTSLSTSGNPISDALTPSIISNTLPQVQLFNNKPITKESIKHDSRSPYESFQLNLELLDDVTRLEQDLMMDPTINNTNNTTKPTLSPQLHEKAPSDYCHVDLSIDPSSSLTHGSRVTFAGNTAKSLLRRRRNLTSGDVDVVAQADDATDGSGLMVKTDENELISRLTRGESHARPQTAPTTPKPVQPPIQVKKQPPVKSHQLNSQEEDLLLSFMDRMANGNNNHDDDDDDKNKLLDKKKSVSVIDPCESKNNRFDIVSRTLKFKGQAILDRTNTAAATSSSSEEEDEDDVNDERGEYVKSRLHVIDAWIERLDNDNDN